MRAQRSGSSATSAACAASARPTGTAFTRQLFGCTRATRAPSLATSPPSPGSATSRTYPRSSTRVLHGPCDERKDDSGGDAHHGIKRCRLVEAEAAKWTVAPPLYRKGNKIPLSSYREKMRCFTIAKRDALLVGYVSATIMLPIGTQITIKNTLLYSDCICTLVIEISIRMVSMLKSKLTTKRNISSQWIWHIKFFNKPLSIIRIVLHIHNPFSYVAYKIIFRS